MSSKVTKAILPVAGLGTRLLPATKSIPKEIMALVDRPLIQYAIDVDGPPASSSSFWSPRGGRGRWKTILTRHHSLRASLSEKERPN